MAAADNPRKRLCEETTCPLCLDFFTNPVMVDCGHNFCKGCILKCWKAPATHTALCPQCRKTIRQRSLRPNWRLASIVDIAKQLGHPAGDICESHQEPLKFFCKEDKALICVVCERSKGHREHHVIPVEEAAEGHKDQIRTSLENLRRKKEELLATKENTGKQSQDLLNMMDTERQKTVAAFRHLQEFLEEEENHLLALMEEVDKEITQKRDADIASLSNELSSLEKTIREMEEECEKLPGELLKNITSKLQRYEQKKFEDPAPFPLSLKWRIWDLWDVLRLLENATKNFKDNLKYKSPPHKEAVTLDPRMTHPQLLVSEDGASLTLGDQHQSLPACVWRHALGYQRFWADRHYWDIDVGHGEGWAIGVSVRHGHREKDKPFGPETGVWAVGKWEGQYRAVIPPLNPPLALSEEPKKIRVSLNCFGRQVAFFDAETAALLFACTISANSFCIYVPFLCLWEKSCLRLDP